MLFTEEIETMDDWDKAKTNPECFTELVKYIMSEEGYSHNQIECLNKGYNISFKIDGVILKIFAVDCQEFSTKLDFFQEVYGLNEANKKAVKTPKLLNYGVVNDKYQFRYVIYEYIEGEMAYYVIHHFSEEGKRNFVWILKELLSKIQTFDFPYTLDFIEKSQNNPRWNNKPEIKKMVMPLMAEIQIKNLCYCHNDITGDNVLINDGVYLLDFADGLKCPYYMEYPPIIFDLFQLDKIMINEFLKDKDYDTFIEDLFAGLLLHEYGYEYIGQIINKFFVEDDYDIVKIKTVLKEFILSCKKM